MPQTIIKTSCRSGYSAVVVECGGAMCGKPRCVSATEGEVYMCIYWFLTLIYILKNFPAIAVFDWSHCDYRNPWSNSMTAELRFPSHKMCSSISNKALSGTEDLELMGKQERNFVNSVCISADVKSAARCVEKMYSSGWINTLGTLCSQLFVSFSVMETLNAQRK